MSDRQNEDVVDDTPVRAVIETRPPFYVVKKKNGRLEKWYGKVEVFTNVRKARSEAAAVNGTVERVVGLLVEIDG